MFAMKPTARSTLFTALNPEVSEELREATVAAIEHFVEKYVEPAKIDTGGGMISWAYNFPWVMNWGISCRRRGIHRPRSSGLDAVSIVPPDSQERYKQLAHEATQFVVTPISKGGSEYDIQGFRLPAEYVYATPPLPNVRDWTASSELQSVFTTPRAFWATAKCFDNRRRILQASQ